MSTEDISAFYDYITQYMKSHIFRIEINDFIDENCGTFFGEDENSFQQYGLHKEFKLLIENLLEKMLHEIGASQELFLLVSKKGLEHPEDKKYYEQLIACDNYVYFKNMMIRRNLQLEEQAMKLMHEHNKSKNKNQENTKNTPEWEELQKIREETELECAIQMSLALEEEKRKLRDLEDEELTVIYIYLKYENKRAIELSKLSLIPVPHVESQDEISLFDPSNLVNINKGDSKTFSSSSIKPNNIMKNTSPDIKVNSASNFQNKKLEAKIISKAENKLDMAFYGPSKASNNNTNTSNDPKNKDYVDVVIDTTEKLQFSSSQTDSSLSSNNISSKNPVPSDLLIQNEIKNKSDINKKNLDNISLSGISNREAGPLVESDLKIIENIFNQSESTIKRNLNQIKKKTYQGDRNFLLQSQKDTSDINSKIEEENKKHQEMRNDLDSSKNEMPKEITNIDEIGKNELAKKLEDLEKEKKEQFKEYREKLLKIKKENRKNETDKDDPFEINDSILSDEVKKRLQMRKELADKLKK